MVPAGEPMLIMEDCWHFKNANRTIARAFGSRWDRCLSFYHYALSIEEGDVDGVFHTEGVYAAARGNQKQSWFRGSTEKTAKPSGE